MTARPRLARGTRVLTSRDASGAELAGDSRTQRPRASRADACALERRPHAGRRVRTGRAATSGRRRRSRHEGGRDRRGELPLAQRLGTGARPRPRPRIPSDSPCSCGSTAGRSSSARRPRRRTLENACRPSSTSSSFRRTTASARWASSTHARSGVTPPTSACTTRSPRCNGSRTTSRVRRRPGTRHGVRSLRRRRGRTAPARIARSCAASSAASSCRAASPTGRSTRPRAALVATTLCEVAGVADLDGLRQLDIDALLAAQAAASGRAPEADRSAPVPSVHRRRAGARCTGRDARPRCGGRRPSARGLDGAGAEHQLRDARAARAGPPARGGRPVPAARSRTRRIGDRRAYAAELGDDGAIWPTLISDVEMQLPLPARARGARGGRRRGHVRVPVRLGGARAWRVPRGRHPVHVRHLRRRRLGRVRRLRRRCGPPRTRAAHRVGRVRARTAIRGGPGSLQPTCSGAHPSTRASTRCSRASRTTAAAADPRTRRVAARAR